MNLIFILLIVSYIFHNILFYVNAELIVHHIPNVQANHLVFYLPLFLNVDILRQYESRSLIQPSLQLQ